MTFLFWLNVVFGTLNVVWFGLMFLTEHANSLGYVNLICGLLNFAVAYWIWKTVHVSI